MLKWIFPILLVFGCGNRKESPSKLVFFEASSTQFEKIVNSGDAGQGPDWNKDIILYNNDYPIEITLFKDKRFHYNLPTLGNGKGHGTWKLEGGKINLYSELDLFDLDIDIHALDEAGKSFALKFVDRHGPNVIAVDVHNMIR